MAGMRGLTLFTSLGTLISSFHYMKYVHSICVECVCVCVRARVCMHACVGGQWLCSLPLQIVMEYCGAGSVADIMRILDRTVCCVYDCHYVGGV